MNFNEFVGIHILDAVEFDNAKEEGDYEDSTICYFRLDGTVYAAIEDPCDGWRSCLGSLCVIEDYEFKNEFIPIRVYCSLSDNESTDTLLFMDYKNDKLVLEIGTHDFDDWYPCFVCDFIPQNMSINEDAE